MLILGTAVMLLAHAGLMMGLALHRAASANARTVETDARLDARIRRAATSIEGLDATLPGGLTGRRLSPELLRVRADSGERAAVGLVWALDPQTRLDELEAPIVAGVPVLDTDRTRITVLEPDTCAEGLTLPPSLPAVSEADWDHRTPLDLGPLGRGDWLPLDLPPRSGSVEAGAYRAPESLVLAAGSWTGLVVVDGSLHVRAGADVAGWVAVSGDVVVDAGGRITGVVRTGGFLRIAEGGVVRAAPCVAVSALASLPLLTSPRLLEPGSWNADRAF